MSRTAGELLRHAPPKDASQQEVDVGRNWKETQGCGEIQDSCSNEADPVVVVVAAMAIVVIVVVVDNCSW